MACPRVSQSDWYVEKRLMEAKLQRFDREIRDRDKLDAQARLSIER